MTNPGTGSTDPVRLDQLLLDHQRGEGVVVPVSVTLGRDARRGSPDEHGQHFWVRPVVLRGSRR